MRISLRSADETTDNNLVLRSNLCNVCGSRIISTHAIYHRVTSAVTRSGREVREIAELSDVFSTSAAYIFILRPGRGLFR